jgi:hypothetical protein
LDKLAVRTSPLKQRAKADERIDRPGRNSVTWQGLERLFS